MANSTIEKLIDAGIQFTEMSRKQADAFVAKLVKAGDVQRQEAERVTQSLIERGKETSERLAAMVRDEVEREMQWLNERYEELEEQFEALAERVGEGVPGRPAKKSTAKKRPAKKSTAKKSTAKKSAAKKAAPVGSSGVRKVSTSRT